TPTRSATGGGGARAATPTPTPGPMRTAPATAAAVVAAAIPTAIPAPTPIRSATDAAARAIASMTSSSAAGASPARPWAGDPLAWLIGPDAVAGFLEQTYERAPLVVRRDDPARFRELLSIAAIDRLISGSDLREGMVDL